ncbi:anti-sigma factor family protein [Roseospira navarrensis]|uniref:Zinc-finger domain-containing protein n=1 Tax=Roseospira navarrensis TaxID=140058 RepID=A0A7X1ZB52_9PROT|nr:hypothetical protein [Roseospira navarrensis]MQX35306.1 hypothetical protein [Roseospira navarrensis]
MKVPTGRDDPTDLKDETLVAYADGELGEREAAAVEARLCADPEAARRLRLLVEAGELARRAFEPVLSETVPEHLVEALRRPAQRDRDGGGVIDLASDRRRRRAYPRVTWKPMAAAAGLALCVAATVGVVVQDRDDRRMAQPGPEIREMLSEQPSYAGVPTGDGTAMVLQSFRTADHRLCREFEVIGTGSVRHGLACTPRHQTDWRLVTWHEDAADAGASAYRPASGEAADPITLSIENLRAGPFLDPEEERRALGDLVDGT